MTLERAMKRRLLQAVGVVVTLPQVDEAECELVQQLKVKLQSTTSRSEKLRILIVLTRGQ